MIECSGIGKVYHTAKAHRVLCNVDLAVQAGERVALLGRSGSGKSTLLHILGLLDVPTSGCYRLDGQDIATLSPHALPALRNKTLGFVFQSFHLIAHLTVLENAVLPLLYQGVEEKAAMTLARSALQAVGMNAYVDAKPHQLSGGQMQRVAIARAIVTKPKVLLADEPTGALDQATGDQIMALLNAMVKQYGMTLVLVTHDQGLASTMDRVLKLEKGSLFDA